MQMFTTTRATRWKHKMTPENEKEIDTQRRCGKRKETMLVGKKSVEGAGAGAVKRAGG